VTSPVPRTKEPHLAGRAYPAAPDQLRAAVAELLAVAGSPVPGLTALLAPHGSWVHSGPLAARAFAAAGRRRRAVLMAPAHFARFEGACVLAMDAYRTPLGPVTIDAEAVAALVRPPLVRSNPAVFLREPGLEVHLPLLQTVAPECRVVPVLVGELGADGAASLAEMLAPLLGPDTLAVASSDLIHYGRRFGYLPVPPTDADVVAAAMDRLDEAALERLAAADAAAFARWVAETGANVCGRAVLEVVLRALPAGARGVRLGSSTSLATTGDYEHVVGYGAMGFVA
jgi:AmmeMemoRadiSam system protein B